MKLPVHIIAEIIEQLLQFGRGGDLALDSLYIFRCDAAAQTGAGLVKVRCRLVDAAYQIRKTGCPWSK